MLSQVFNRLQERYRGEAEPSPLDLGGLMPGSLLAVQEDGEFHRAELLEVVGRDIAVRCG